MRRIYRWCAALAAGRSTLGQVAPDRGVSAFQIQFASTDITTPGDHADVLIAMNPAALKADLHTVERGGTVILNEDAFTARNIEKAGYAADPRQDGTLEGFQLFEVPM